MAVDYFQTKYPVSMVVFDMTIVYIMVAFVAVLTNNLLVETLSFTCRINIGTHNTTRQFPYTITDPNSTFLFVYLNILIFVQVMD